MESEKSIMNRCLVKLSTLPGVRVWRNNTGALRDSNGQLVRFGLPGSGDIIGLRSIVITPEMVGQTIGQFLAVETKRPGGKQTEQQEKFESMVVSLGGVYVLATNPDEAMAAFSKGDSHDK